MTSQWKVDASVRLLSQKTPGTSDFDDPYEPVPWGPLRTKTQHSVTTSVMSAIVPLLRAAGASQRENMKLVDEIGLSESDATSLLQGVSDGAYSLLLGAGASYGCIGGDGEALKGAIDLAHEINDLFQLELDESERSNLPLVYNDAKRSSNKGKLSSFLEQRFSRCEPVWQQLILGQPWKRIWSLNIDDVVERCRSATPRRITTFTWTDQFKPRELNSDELQVIHLHGYAPRLSDPAAQVIFSISEYAGRFELAPGWHAEFRSEFCQKPFVVCGAKLQEEYDLATVLEFGSHSKARGGAPSFVVLKELTKSQSDRFARQGFIAVRANGQTFFDALQADIAASDRKYDQRVTFARNQLLASFKILDIDRSRQPTSKKILDFYACAEAQWMHIVNDLDARIGINDRIKVSLDSAPDEKIPRFALVSGGPISGKTTVALRIAHEYASRGTEVWWFRGEQKFDEQSLLDYVKRQPNSVFIFDDCADFSSSLRTLVSLSLEQGVLIRGVATCESHRLRATESDLEKSRVIKENIEPLTRQDFERLFEKRKAKGRLGTKSSMSVAAAWKEYKSTYGFKLLEWLESLENASAYRDAILNLIKSPAHHGEIARALVCGTAAVHRFGFSLPFYIADEIRRGESLEVLLGEGEALYELAFVDDRGLRLRNKSFSTFVWKSLCVTEKYSWALKIARAVAPLVVPRSVSQRSTPYLIIRELMDWENVKHDLGGDSERWYADLEDVCGWNSRFWEQRALLASDQKSESFAYSYAKKAIALHGRDAFPHTTLGKVCLKIATTRNDAVAVERYWEGVEALRESRVIALSSGTEWEHPYITFFSYTLRAVRLAVFAKERERMSQAWNDWMRSAKASRNLHFLEDNGHNSLDDYQRNWLSLASE